MIYLRSVLILEKGIYFVYNHSSFVMSVPRSWNWEQAGVFISVQDKSLSSFLCVAPFI